MAEIIRMPLLSDTMTEGNIIAWHKKVGDVVKSDDVLAEVETDKATMELIGYVDGVLLHIEVPKGSATVNGMVAIIGKKGEDISALLAEESKSSNLGKLVENKVPLPSSSDLDFEKLGITPIRMPLLSDTMTEGKIVAWHKKVGDIIKSDDVLAEVETDKATMELIGYVDGVLLYRGVEAGKSAAINSLVAVVGKKGVTIDDTLLKALQGPVPSDVVSASSSSMPPPTVPTTSSISSVPVLTTDRLKASPLAKSLAKEKGITLSSIKGTGEGGRIIKRDIVSYQPIPTTTTTTTPDFMPTLVDEVVSVSSMRKVIAQRLSESKQQAPHFYLSLSIEMSQVMQARKRINEVYKLKISINDIVLKAVAKALLKHPDVNASWKGDSIIKHGQVNIAVAVAIEDGLLVPVVKDADKKNLVQISNEVKDLAQRAKERKLKPEDWSGNTFTISNLGMFGIEHFTSIINTPDVAILAIGAIMQKPIVREGAIVIGNMMQITLSGDHRAIDGAVGAAFLQTLKNYLEEPLMML